MFPHHPPCGQAKLSSYFARGTVKGEGKRKFENLPLKGGVSPADQASAKRSRAEKKKITSFFAPKSNKNLDDTNDNQDLKIQKEDLDPESRLALASHEEKSASCKDNQSAVTATSCAAKSVRSTKDNSSAVNAWSSMFNKAAVVAPVCAGHSEPCARRKVNKKGPNTGREFWCCARGEGRCAVVFNFDLILINSPP